MEITRRNRIKTIEDILKIRTELNIKNKVSGQSTFKVWRLKNNAYIYDGIFSKDDLIMECNI